MSDVHATTGIGTTLFVLAAAGAMITVLAIALDRFLDRLGRRREVALPRATAREHRSHHEDR